MKQIEVKTPPPPPEFDLSDDDLLVIKAATPAATPATAPELPLASLTHSVSSPIMPYSEYVKNAAPDTSNRNRLSIRFTLNLRNEVEYALAAWLDPLRSERKFNTAIKDALRLYRDLRAGQYGVLRELFPGVYERILAENCPQAQPTKPAPDTGLHAQLERLEALLLAGNTTNTGGPKALNVPKVAGPKADDDDVKLNIRKAKSTGNASENFLKSAFAVAGIQ